MNTEPSSPQPRHILIVFALPALPQKPLPDSIEYPFPAGNLVGIMAVARALAADMMLQKIGVARCTGCGELNTGQVYIMCDNAPAALRSIQTTLEAVHIFSQCAVYLFDDEGIFRRVHSHSTGLLPEALKCEAILERLEELKIHSIASMYFFNIVHGTPALFNAVHAAAALPDASTPDPKPDTAA